jgi:hypothetical protein
MSTNIATMPSASVPATSRYADFAESASSRTRLGEMLKFNKGDYLVGKDGASLALGTNLVAVMPTLEIYWQKWWGAKPVAERPIRGGRPYRDELGDTDPELWETDPVTAQRREPWQKTAELVLVDPSNDAVYTFTTSSTGGRDALGMLARAFDKARAQHPDSLPVIELGSGSYLHSNRSIGRVKVPELKVVDYVDSFRFIQLIAAERGELVEDRRPPSAEAPSTSPNRPKLQTVTSGYSPIEDDIPFACEGR